MSSSSKSSHNRHGHQEPHYDYDQFAGAEPGVNPRSGSSVAEYSHFKQDCVIDIIDYDSDDANFQRVDNAGLIRLLQQKTPEHKNEGDLPPRMVRWINIGGIDWSVLSALALKYNLHSLALEDILHERGHNQSKADYYPGHMFIRVLCYTVVQDDSVPSHAPSPADTPLAMSREASTQGLAAGARTNGVHLEEGNYPTLPTPDPTKAVLPTDDKALRPSPFQMNVRHPSTLPLDKGKTVVREGFRSSLKKRLGALSGFREPARERQMRQILALTKDERVCHKHEPLFIFLLRDGTVISTRATPSLDYTTPITDRLHRFDSVLRTSEDPSLLVQGLLDLVVDRILELVDEYQVRIHKLEADVLLNSDMDTVRSLHIISGDLIMHKRALEPIKTMLYGLRRYDLDRCLALAETMAMDTHYGSDDESEATKRRRQRAKEKQLSGGSAFAQQGSFSSGGTASSASSVASRDREEQRIEQKMRETAKRRRLKGSNRTKKVEGYFSYKSKVYLADVYDHMDFALTSLDMFADITENLINYAFNMASYEMNTVMKRLTLVTIIFLPLTLLTGYFGMNFKTFWSVEQHSDAFFWEIGAPVMVTLVSIFLFEDIKKFFKYMRRKAVMQNAVKVRRTQFPSACLVN
ncbi:hypothetical protein CPB83DRAFT_754377 [Crepidotus variabilis]|uniref:Uncharacterized protein n=1 Tax=Crepidotus variabilis TaxID=179855 RepID=A0A9P6EVF5_9AGAR|nr:hypothetical protein CPB83DRAFT_754377 [Crepidotus variabilis]